MENDDLATEIYITPLGKAFLEWVDAKPPRTNTVSDLNYYGELAAFCAGWKAALQAQASEENDHAE